jgi:16S rRNA processing protein RimM
MMDNYVEVGYTGKPHGINGQLKLVVEEAFERDVLQSNVLFIDMKGHPIPFFVEDLSVGNAWIVKFEDVDTRESAAGLSSKGIFLRREDLMPPEARDPDEEPNYLLYVGYFVVDTELGVIGNITDIYDLGMQTLAGVQYQGREVLVPMHPDLIREIHDDVRELVMELPKGILEL